MTIIAAHAASGAEAIQSRMISPNLSPASPVTSRLSPQSATSNGEVDIEADSPKMMLGEAVKSKAGGFKASNFSIAALINKDSEDELERRRRLVESVPILGKIFLRLLQWYLINYTV